jgi:hypothetical protein
VPDARRLTRNPAIARVPLRSSLAVAGALASLFAFGVLACGCGGGSKAKSSAATVPAVSKAQFLAEGNAICKQGQQRGEADQKALEKRFAHRQPTAAELTAYVRTTFVPLIQGQISGLRALGAPAGEQAKITNLLNIAQTDLDRVKGNPGALVTQQHPFASFARLAHAYGLTSCAANA